MCLLNMMNWITSSFNKISYSKFVLRKQLHMCQGPKRCYKTSKHCKYGFLYDINLNSHAKINKNTNKWEYFQLKHYDWDVLPYHPILLLIWGAHLNIQIITSSFCSYYLLKYTMKIEPHDILNINTIIAKQLSLQNVNEMHLKFISAMILAKLMTSTKVFITCLKILIT
jgi:hypothetical protein